MHGVPPDGFCIFHEIHVFIWHTLTECLLQARNSAKHIIQRAREWLHSGHLTVLREDTFNKLKKKIYLKIFIYTFKKREPEQKSAYYLS